MVTPKYPVLTVMGSTDPLPRSGGPPMDRRLYLIAGILRARRIRAIRIATVSTSDRLLRSSRDVNPGGRSRSAARRLATRGAPTPRSPRGDPPQYTLGCTVLKFGAPPKTVVFGVQKWVQNGVGFWDPLPFKQARNHPKRGPKIGPKKGSKKGPKRGQNR